MYLKIALDLDQEALAVRVDRPVVVLLPELDAVSALRAGIIVLAENHDFARAD